MKIRTLVHLSDLHLGRDPGTDAAVSALATALTASSIDHVVVTGDLTHRGRRDELQRFRRTFGALADAGRLTVVPGNHDRLGDDAAADLMPGPRVQASQPDGLYLVRVDSTGPHNRSSIVAHGVLTGIDIDAIGQALALAPEGRLTCVLLHHHLLPLPEEHLGERLATWLGRPWAAELACGPQILASLYGRCDLVLHGHRHRPSELRLAPSSPRPLSVFNAGESAALGMMRLFRHRDGRLLGPPRRIGITALGRERLVA